MRNIFGDHSQSHENELASGVSDSLVELEKQAEQLGADPVIGVGRRLRIRRIQHVDDHRVWHGP
jgi:uncharacterized protein YbjQ (UPF0145 family)